jgi:hypothetical protein
MNKEFEKICKMSQASLKNHVRQRLQKTHGTILNRDGYVYAQGKFPVLLVAHLDTVHEKLPNMFMYSKKNNRVSSPNGIGGDDRCGVYMIFKILEKFNCSVLFCEDEEVGCVGSSKFADSELARNLEFNYIIEFDRANANDAVFYSCANDEFEDFITKEFYKTAYGSYSDICEIAPALGCAAVNLSCGYYAAHTKNEYVILSEMERSIKEACKILERTTEADKFEYVEAPSRYGSLYNFNNYADSYSYEDVGYDYGYYLIEYVNADGATEWYDTDAFTKEEAVGRFLMSHPDISYGDVVDVCVDKEVYRYC